MKHSSQQVGILPLFHATRLQLEYEQREKELRLKLDIELRRRAKDSEDRALKKLDDFLSGQGLPAERRLQIEEEVRREAREALLHKPLTGIEEVERVLILGD